MIWSIPGKAIRTLQEGSPQRGQATCVSFGAKGRLLAAFCDNGTVCWEVQTGRKVGRLTNFSERPYSAGNRRIALSPLSNLIVGVKSESAEIEAATELHAVNVSPGGGYGFAFSNDASLVAGAIDK